MCRNVTAPTLHPSAAKYGWHMSDRLTYQLLADAVLTLHVGIVGFVIGGLVLTIVGNMRRWRWVNRLGFRLAHLAAIGFVAVQA